ncbi:MAG TPA: DUF305 domain-containing protein [Gemmatimonadales bacterium]
MPRRWPLKIALAAAAAFASPAAGQTSSAQHHVEADIRFMQGMIGHHAQALDMATLVASRTDRPDMRLLAERIDVSQKDEIAFMRRWLTDRGAEAPVPEPGHAHHGHLMPGMLTAEEMARLEQARGTAFDRLFLEGMIRHHQGALVMVKELFDAGGAQESELFRFASDVDTDQRAEIQRMRALLASLPDS